MDAVFTLCLLFLRLPEVRLSDLDNLGLPSAEFAHKGKSVADDVLVVLASKGWNDRCQAQLSIIDAWKVLYEARCVGRDESHRMLSLAKYRALVGWDAYYKGKSPPLMPWWLFDRPELLPSPTVRN